MKAFLIPLSMVLSGVVGGLASAGLTTHHSVGVSLTIGMLLCIGAFSATWALGYHMGKGEFE